MSLIRRLAVVVFSVVLLLAAGAAMWVGAGAARPDKPVPTVTPQAFADPALEQAVIAELAAAGFRQPAGDPIIRNVALVDNWAFGTAAIPAPPVEDAAPVSTLFLARYQDGQWQAALHYSAQFNQWLATAPEALLSAEARDTLTGGTGESMSQISLPWAAGETWFLWGGPHHNCGWNWSGCDNDDRPWSSLDFDGPSGQARAAGDGIAYRPCDNQVIIAHGDGWETKYYHLENIAVANGQAVSRGDLLGTTSTGVGCGGYATGPHVHFALIYNGAYQEMHGQEIGGWQVSQGAAQYEGCMAKDGSVQCAPGGAIFNDGSYSSNVTGRDAWTAGPEWQPRDEFVSGDFLYWVLDVENEGGSDALVQLTFDIRREDSPPGSPPAVFWQGEVLTPPGVVSWGLPGLAPAGGTYVFSGTVAYQGLTSTHTATFTVHEPPPTPTLTPSATAIFSGTATPMGTPTITPTMTATPSATPPPAEPACAAPLLAIPDNDPAGISHSLLFTNTGTLVDLDVSLLVSHTWVGDLSFTLIHEESGTVVTLIDRPGVPATTWGCSENDIDVLLDDAAALPVETACAGSPPALRDTLKPQEPLAAFTGRVLAGTWTLVAADHAENDLGTLAGWCLLPETGTIPTPTPQTTPAPVIMPSPTPTPSPTPRPLLEKLYIPLVSR